MVGLFVYADIRASSIERMELNEPITAGGELHFCEEGNRLAFEFLRKSHEVLTLVYSEDVFRLRKRLDAALIPLTTHVAICTVCNEA
jgi:hypothetical protein